MKFATILLTSATLIAAGAPTWTLAADKTESQHQWVKKADAQGKTYWTCAMHPQVHQHHPGNCPICGMALMKVTASSAADKSHTTPSHTP